MSDNVCAPDRRDQQDQGTRERLLAAAAQVFAAHGQSATVREICNRAGANVAAVNYHFGSKDNLYAAMLDHYMCTCAAAYPLDAGVAPGSPPEVRLRAFVHGLLMRLLGESDNPVSQAHGKLVTLELMDASPAFEGILRDHITPVNDLLAEILTELLGPAANDCEIMRICIQATFGHIMFHFSGRAATIHFDGATEITPAVLERIADGITRFTLGGVAALAATLQESATQ